MQGRQRSTAVWRALGRMGLTRSRHRDTFVKLAIFDVDGTLLNNLASEDACFAKAVSEVLHLPGLNTDWSTYRHVTDCGIATEAYRQAYDKDPPPDLLDAAVARFLELLVIAHRTERFTEVAGASNLLITLPSLGWSVAIATGAWQRAASFKLTAGALPWEHLPIATAEDDRRARTSCSALARGRKRSIASPPLRRSFRSATACGTSQPRKPLAFRSLALATASVRTAFA